MRNTESANQPEKNDGPFGATLAGQFGYDALVCSVALERAGGCPMLKGHIQEILFCNRLNFSPHNFLNGRTASLSPNVGDPVADLMIKQDGRIVERIQVKDVESASGISRLIEQIGENKYQFAKIYGSPETVGALASAAGREVETVRSTGISSSRTRALAHGVGAHGAGTFVEATVSAALRGAAIGASVSGVIALFKGAARFYRVEATLDEVLQTAAKEALSAGLAGGAAAVAAMLAGACTARVLPTAAPIVFLIVAVLIGIVVKKHLDGVLEKTMVLSPPVT